MSKGKIISALLCLGSAIVATGQNNTSSPYSRYGYGTLVDGASAQGRGMGGLSIGIRDNQFTNFGNPATYTAIDSLNFRFELAASLRSSFYSSGDSKSSDLSGNLERIGLHFPIKNWMGLAVGIEPYSIVGYNYSDSKKELEVNSNDNYINSYAGEGGINQVILGLGFRPWKPFSLGCNIKFLFGDITTQSGVSFSESKNENFFHNIGQATQISVHDLAVTFGAQYVIEAGEDKSVVIGATFEPKNKLNADASKTVLTTGVDTLNKEYDSAFELPFTMGLGASYNIKNKWTFGVDYKFQKWGDVEYFGEKVLENRNKLSLGAELRPNTMSKKYFDRVSYRWGFSTANTYYNVHGETNRENLLSAGFGFPLKRGLNPTVINFTVEYGFTTLSNKDMMSDNFLRFVLNATLNEKWFVRRRLE
ncbi:MAG: hypothetical protein KBT22_01555 [Bacteroidales bacterium]|nr:hypothetical protein [Candidatus Scybalocola fimicaballi]